MKKVLFAFMIFFLFFACQHTVEKPAKSPVKEIDDLEAILKKDTLTVLTENGAISFYEYKDKYLGFEYEILDSFARHIGVHLKIVEIANPDDYVLYLNERRGDIIACNKPIHMEDKKIHAFSIPYNHSFEVLVQRSSEDSVIRDISKLKNKDLYIRKKSSFVKRILHLEDEIGQSINVKSVEGYPVTEDLIEMVSRGEIDYTISMENTARIEQACHPNIDISTLLSVRQNIAFGLRKSDVDLKEKLDYFLDEFLESEGYELLQNKYFDYMKETNFFIDELDSVTNINIELSKYDELFKASALKRNWDWRFLASIAYQESRYDPDARGFGGAYGMMQFMPNTGPSFDVYPDSPPAVQIDAGMRYIDQLYNQWSQIDSKEQRLKFTLASYNAGKGHIDDAVRLAEKFGYNPLVWDENVELMIKNLSIPEHYRNAPVKYGAYRGPAKDYVKSIYSRYMAWKLNE
jgi:membrane-bound lytic murein transglycosylase F